eukprot:1641671-Amphidinium_carterae.1
MPIVGESLIHVYIDVHFCSPPLDTSVDHWQQPRQMIGRAIFTWLQTRRNQNSTAQKLLSNSHKGQGMLQRQVQKRTNFTEGKPAPVPLNTNA